MRTEKNKKVVVGLTGGMGSGKSTVLGMFRRKKAFTCDADAIVKNLLGSPRILKAVRKLMGPSVFENGGILNKRKLANMVFQKPKMRKDLEGLLHPLVRKEMWGGLESSKAAVAVLDIPLLYESKWEDKLDAVIVVAADMKQRIFRLRKKGFSMADAKRRINAQMKLSEKIKKADFIVDNNGTVIQTKKQVDEIWKVISNPNTRRNYGLTRRK